MAVPRRRAPAVRELGDVAHDNAVQGVGSRGTKCLGRRSADVVHPSASRRLVGVEVRMAFLLWILAVVLVIAGVVAIVRGQLLWGIVLIIVGLLVGPGGVSVFT